MREIKFRGKRKDNGKWVYGNLITDNRLGRKNCSINYFDDMDCAHEVRVLPETVGQYTGLKDKNDKEIKKIYEGDIVKAKISEEYTNVRKIIMQGEVTYYEPFACFEIKTKDSGQPMMSVFISFEIIGNIYENPELLAGNNE